MTQERSLTGAGAASSQRYQVWQLRLQFIIDLLFFSWFGNAVLVKKTENVVSGVAVDLLVEQK